MYKTILLVLAMLIFDEGDRKSLFTSPLDIPLTLSANFAELRPGHFHSGVDLKTSGVTGKKVYAVDDGYIYRISIGPGGFGNAIYIRHNNAYSSVYGHLDRFMPDIEKYATEAQYKRESFSINLFPGKDDFKVKKGEQIAFSGNTGSSMGPHLHFELRRTSNENPIDPIRFFDIEDNIKPVLKTLYIYPVSSESINNGENVKQAYSLIGSSGKYSIKDENVIETSNEFGIGISNHDFINNSWNKCGSRIIRLSLDDTVYYKHTLDEFSFSQTRYINSHIDYAEYIKTKTYIQKTFVDPNNFLAIYDTLKNNGIISLTDNDTHRIKLEILDYSDNKSVLEFLVKANSVTTETTENSETGRLMPYNRNNNFDRHDIRVHFPSDAFYKNLNFLYKKIPGDASLLADIHSVHNNTVPLHKAFKLAIKPNTEDSTLLSKAGIIRINGRDTIFVGGKYKDGLYECSVRELGDYSIGVDSTSPDLYPLNFNSNDKLSGRDELKFHIDDDFSGIAEYYGTIDGEWALFEWDPKNKLIKYIFRKGTLTANREHSVKVKAVDLRNNATEYEGKFFW